MEAFFQTFFDWGEMRDVLPTLLTEGIRNTLLIAVLAALLGLVIGMVLAMMLLSRSVMIRLPARIYVDICIVTGRDLLRGQWSSLHVF